VLIAGILLGLVLGLLAGGSIGNLATVRLRWVGVLLLAVILRFGTEYLLIRGNELVDALRLPLFVAAFAMLLAALWVNRGQPGLGIAFVGVLLNTIAIVANAGHMPIWEPSLISAGFTTADLTPFHVLLSSGLNLDFLLHAGPLADILPIPIPIIRNVASIGDVFLTAGLAVFLFATVVRPHEDVAAEEAAADAAAAASAAQLQGLAGTARMPRSLSEAIGGQRVRPGTGLAPRLGSGLSPGLAETAALNRPLVLGTPGTGLAGPSNVRLMPSADSATFRATAVGARVVALAPVPAAGSIPIDDRIAVPARPRVEVGVRVRRHPYVRLALNSNFSALWTGQLISLFGDRVHQIGLTFLVAAVTDSPVAVAFVFVAATLPNLLLSPVAGAYVDRWNQRDVMIVSDLLRAAAVLMIPIVAAANIYLIYPLIFLITSISIFFRPARVAVLPRIVRSDELVTANSAMWAGETFADVMGYPLAGIFVAFLGSALPLAFWFDAATYAASAILIASISVPAVRRHRAASGADTGPDSASGVIAEMREGLRFLRRDQVLFANTIQAAFAQLSLGALTALTPIFVRDVLAPTDVDPKAAYAFLETAIGIGNLMGGFVIGLIGMRLARGRAVIGGYVLWGASIVLFAISGNLAADFGILLGAGIANMLFVIPSQVLFQERTPADMIGRVIGFRFALVFGSMTLAMALGGLAASVVGTTAVLVVTGVIAVVAGLAGLFVPEARDA
jgi:predicted MFS family arabinose efflux permease